LGPIGIGPELVKGWAWSCGAQSPATAQTIAATAVLALASLTLMLAFSAEITANSSLYRPVADL
jgi:hypothetical protein